MTRWIQAWPFGMGCCLVAFSLGLLPPAAPLGEEALAYQTGSLSDGAVLGNLRSFEEPLYGMVRVAFSADGRHALRESEKMVQVLDVETGKIVRRYESTAQVRYFLVRNQLVAYDATTKQSPVSDPFSAKEVATTALGDARDVSLRGLAFAPDWQRAVTAWFGNQVQIRDPKTGKVVRSLEGHQLPVMCVAFSSDGRQILSGSKDKTMRLWDAATGRMLRQLRGHTEEVNAVAFSPDGRRALSGSEDKTVRLWDLATGKELRRMTGHQNGVTGVVFSPDGQRALSGGGPLGAGEPYMAYLWDLETGKIIGRPNKREEGKGHWVTALAFSPDGRQALLGAAGGVLWEDLLPKSPGQAQPPNRASPSSKADETGSEISPCPTDRSR